MFKKSSLLYQRLKESGATIPADRELGSRDEEILRQKTKEAVRQLDAELLNKKHLPEIESKIREYILNFVSAEGAHLQGIMPETLDRLGHSIADEILGLGPIQPLLQNPEITNVIVRGPGQGNVDYEKDGKIHTAEDIFFPDKETLLDVIQRIIAPIGRRLDETSPQVEGWLPDGSRVSADIAPVAVTGPYLAIRKFRKNMSVDELVRRGTITEREVELFKAMVRARLNIMVSGGMSSGKTTLLNCISSFIPKDEEIILIEDIREMQLDQPRVRHYVSKPPNMEGKGEITIRQLLERALRRYAHRIIVGEVRGIEALDMLRAMNTGHPGSLSTGHADSAQQLIEALVNMIILYSNLSEAGIKRQVAASLDVIVQAEKLQDGSHKVVQVTEVLGMDGEEIATQDILTFDYVKGVLMPTGVKSKLPEKMRKRGIEPPAWLQGA